MLFRSEGGNKQIGTGGTSPFGAYGYNPEGIRMGQEKGRHGKAVKVWDKREYKNLDDTVEIGTRNIKIALRRLRKFAREGAEVLSVGDAGLETAAPVLRRNVERLERGLGGDEVAQRGVSGVSVFLGNVEQLQAGLGRAFARLGRAGVQWPAPSSDTSP